MEQHGLLNTLSLKGLGSQHVDEAITQHRAILMIRFMQHWGRHRCGIPGEMGKGAFDSLGW
jgi:hypothetical protein